MKVSWPKVLRLLMVKLITLTHTLVMLSRTLGETLKVNGITLMKMVLPLQVLKLSMVKNFTLMKMEVKLKAALLRMQMVLIASTKKVLES